LNSQIIENLGQINLLLTDKTGTLTQGVMTMKKIYVDEQDWNLDLGLKAAEPEEPKQIT
jgi:P-type E1-E2 ATPase